MFAALATAQLPGFILALPQNLFCVDKFSSLTPKIVYFTRPVFHHIRSQAPYILSSSITILLLLLLLFFGINQASVPDQVRKIDNAHPYRQNSVRRIV
jgi:hypothetical protein